MPPADLAERLWEVSDEVLAPGADVRIDALAERAGIPRATLYYYFSGKDDVLAFLLAQKLRRGTDAVAAAARSRGGVVRRLSAVIRAMCHTMADHPELCTRLLSGVANESTGGTLMAEVERNLMAPVRELLSEARESGELIVADVTDTTLSLMGAVAIVAMVRTATGTFDPDRVADRLVAQFLDGLRPRGARRR